MAEAGRPWLAWAWLALGLALSATLLLAHPAAVVGACDGDLPLGVLVGAVAGLLDVGPDDLAADVLPQVRRLVEEGYLLDG